MTVKVAESEFAALCGVYNIWAHKWRHVTKCPRCSFSFYSRTTEVNDNRPEEEREAIVDYEIFIERDPIWVECKGKHGTTSWAFSDMDPKQRNFLQSWTDRGVMACVFLLCGKGQAPKSRGAWFIPYLRFKDEANTLLAAGRKSFSYEYLDTHWGLYRLGWDNGGWSIPDECWLKLFYPNVTQLPALYK